MASSHPQADLSISGSGTAPCPAYSVIDRVYVEGGLYAIGGVNVRLNQREQPIVSRETRDFSQVLDWLTEQFVAFYDVADRRTWLVDGASALLHLVRISLQMDEANPDSTYDWVFDKNKLKENGINSGGRASAIRTLKDWDNRALKVYIKDRSFLPGGQPVDTYSTFGNRVDRILHTLELVIEHQTRIAAEDGIRFSHKVGTSKHIVGFDILDLVKSRPQIVTHIGSFDLQDRGWVNLLPDIGVLTVFGNGFGDLICPSNPDSMCAAWRSVPKGKNHLASTLSTLALLQQFTPGLVPGGLTSKLGWMSPCQPFDSCQCIKGEQVRKHYDPSQYVVSSSLLKKPSSRGEVAVGVSTLAATGAVVFSNLSHPGGRVKVYKAKKRGKKVQAPTTASMSNSGTDNVSVSASQSNPAQASGSANPTETSAQVACPPSNSGNESLPASTSQSITAQSSRSTNPTETSAQVAGPALTVGSEGLPTSISQSTVAHSSSSTNPTETSAQDTHRKSSQDQSRTRESQSKFPRLKEGWRGIRRTLDLASRRANRSSN
jgi:hypothetical protein